MKIILSVFLLFFSFHLIAQITFNNEYIFGHPAYHLSSVYPTDSCYYVAGITVDTIAPHNDGIFFTKLNLTGEVEFSTFLFDSLTHYTFYKGTLTPAPDGTIWGTGYGFDTLGRFGYGIQFSPYGDTLKTVRFRSPYFPEEQLLSPLDFKLSDQYTLLFVNAIFNSEFDNHRYITEIDTFGNIINEITLTAPNYSLFGSSIIQEDSIYYVAFYKTNSFVAPKDFFRQNYLLKLDSNLNIIDDVFYPSSPEIGILEHAASHLIKTSDGNYLGVGSSGYEYSINAGSSSLKLQPFLLKFNPDLEIIWKKEFLLDTFETTPLFFRRAVEAPDYSGYVATGLYNRKGGIAKTSPNGDSLWVRSFQFLDVGTNTHELVDIETTPDGGYIMAGYFINFSNDIPPPIQRGWVVKVDEYGCLVPGCHLVSTEEEQVQETPIYLKIYPNPASTSAYFYTTDIAALAVPKVLIHNLQGQLIKEFDVPSSNTTYILQTYDFPSGIYSVSLMDKGRVIDNQQLVIQQ